MEGENSTRDKVTKGGEGRRGQGPLAKEGVFYLDICVGVPEFLVTPLLTGDADYLARAGLKSQSASGLWHIAVSTDSAVCPYASGASAWSHETIYSESVCKRTKRCSNLPSTYSTDATPPPLKASSSSRAFQLMTAISRLAEHERNDLYRHRLIEKTCTARITPTSAAKYIQDGQK